MKRLLGALFVFLFAVTVSAVFTGCASKNPHQIVRESVEPRPPLDSLAAVKIVYARDVPVLPENLELVATMAGASEGACIAGYATFDEAERFKKWARELGANYVYVKVPGPDSSWPQLPCGESTVEYHVEVDGGNNEKN